jgi:hypothetical protein
MRPDYHVLDQFIKYERGTEPTESNGPNQQKQSWLYCHWQTRRIGSGMNACLHRKS